MSVSGNRIKECRKENHFTQEDVAKKLGIGKQAVYKYEIGAVTNIPLESIITMAEMFNVTPEYLAGWSDHKKPFDPEAEERYQKYSAKVDEFLLAEKEKCLVRAFRLADPKYQDLALELLDEHPLKKE